MGGQRGLIAKKGMSRVLKLDLLVRRNQSLVLFSIILSNAEQRYCLQEILDRFECKKCRQSTWSTI